MNDWPSAAARQSAAGGLIELPPGTTAEVCFSPGRENCMRIAIAALQEARRRVLLAAYGFTSSLLLQALIELQERGVAVELVLDRINETDERSAAAVALAAGIDVRVDRTVPIMHDKVAVIDDAAVITGSANWTRAAAHNSENIVILRGAPGVAAAYTGHFRERQAVAVPFRRQQH